MEEHAKRALRYEARHAFEHHCPADTDEEFEYWLSVLREERRLEKKEQEPEEAQDLDPGKLSG